MDQLLHIKWCKKVLKKIQLIDGYTVQKLKILLDNRTLNTSMSAMNKSFFHKTSTKTLKEALNCSKQAKLDFCANGF